MTTSKSGHKRLHRNGRSGKGGLRAIVAALVLILTGTSSAWAHQDPIDCSQPTIVFGMRAFFAGTNIQIETAARINECTEVEYKAFVMSIGSAIACAFQGGTITITTPDGEDHDATPAGGIPCLGGTAAPCVSGENGPGALFVDVLTRQRRLAEPLHVGRFPRVLRIVDVARH